MMRQAEHRKVIKNATSLGQNFIAVMVAALLASTAAANANGAEVCRDTAQKKQWTRALPACTAAANRGDAGAQFNLGKMYELGQGVVKDYAQAARWYTLAAAQGDASAQHILGILYKLGLGVVQDYAQAVRWWTLAAERGDINAQFWLGEMYSLGRGVAQDYVRAHMWYNLAAVSGNSGPVMDRDALAAKMTREQIAQAQRMAADCLAKKFKAC